MQCDPALFRVGKMGLLADCQTFFWPVQFRADELVDVEPALIVKVDAVPVFPVVLHSGARAAPKVVSRARMRELQIDLISESRAWSSFSIWR